jgi:hypothetical protein
MQEIENIIKMAKYLQTLKKGNGVGYVELCCYPANHDESSYKVIVNQDIFSKVTGIRIYRGLDYYGVCFNKDGIEYETQLLFHEIDEEDKDE